MPKFRLKPVIIEAIRWTGENIEDIVIFMAPDSPSYIAGFLNSDDLLGIQSLEGFRIIGKGDWLIKSGDGNFDSQGNETFLETCEKIL